MLEEEHPGINMSSGRERARSACWRMAQIEWQTLLQTPRYVVRDADFQAEMAAAIAEQLWAAGASDEALLAELLAPPAPPPPPVAAEPAAAVDDAETLHAIAMAVAANPAHSAPGGSSD